MSWFSICFHDWEVIRRNYKIYYRCRKCGKVEYRGEKYL